MKNRETSRLTTCGHIGGWIVLMLLTFLVQMRASAQVNAYLFRQSLSTYTPITGTQVDSLNEDDVFHDNIPIGFSFNYNGNVTDRMGICTNGYIVMDSFSRSPLWAPTSSTINQINVLMADLKNTNAGGGSIEYTVQGTAPNRICIVQWKNYAVAGVNTARINAQIRLFEGSNCIQLCYGENIITSINGKAFSVGLIGNNQLDYNLRLSNANQWLNSAKSTSFPGNGMFLNPSVDLPEGMVYSFGACAVAGVPYYYFQGTVYKDANNNGQRDGGEIGISQVVVYDSIHNRFTMTDHNGDYNLPFHDSTLLHSLKVFPPMFWSITSFPPSFNVFPFSQTVIGRDFGMNVTSTVSDIHLEVHAFNAPKSGEKVTMVANYWNAGTTFLPGDTLMMVKDARYAFVNANIMPTYMNGDTLIWNYLSLQPLASNQIRITFLTNIGLLPTDTLNSYWFIKNNTNDITPSNNEQWLVQPVNTTTLSQAKVASPEGPTLPDQEIVYTLSFQNTVVPSIVENVVLRDTLNSNLNIGTFRLIGATHPLTYTLSNAGHLVFKLSNIMLPDSSTNEPESHGAVMFSVKTKANLAANTSIPNRASHYFDFESPIQTNTTQNIIILQWPSSLSTVNANIGLKVYPNPSSDVLHTLWADETAEVQVQLFSLSGKLMFQFAGPAHRLTQVSLRDYASGLYYLSAITKQGKVFIPVLKQ